MRVFLRELFFARTNFRDKFSNYFFQFSPERISTKETSFKYFARIEFHKFHEKHISRDIFSYEIKCKCSQG